MKRLLPLITIIIGIALRWYGLDWSLSHVFTFHPDEMRLFYAVDKISWQPVFRMTRQTFEQLEAEQISSLVIAALQPLHNQQFNGKAEFLAAVEQQIGQERTARHKKLILRHATWKSPNPEFFAYGSLPIYLLKLVYDTTKTSISPNANLVFVGRILSAIWGSLTLVLLYRFGKRFFSERVALLSTALLAFTALHIQLCHFLTVDVMLTFFVLLALYFMISIVETPHPLRYYTLAGIATGLALAVKISALPLYGVLLGAHLLLLLKTRWTRSFTRYPPRSFWIMFFLALLLSGIVFLLCQPYTLLDFQEFSRQIKEQNDMARGVIQPPYTIQYEGTLPYLYHLKHLLLYSMGLPAGLLVVLGTLVFTLKTVVNLREIKQRFAAFPRPIFLILLWVLPVFAIVGGFQVKFLRYILPLIPFLCLFGALLVDLVYKHGHHLPGGVHINLLSLRKDGHHLPGGVHINLLSRNTIIILALLLIIGFSAFYAVAFVTVYQREDPRIQASRWIYEHVDPGSTLLTELWEFAPVVGVDGRHPGHYQEKQLNLYAQESDPKIHQMAQMLSQGDVLILATKRLYGSILRVPEDYPLTTAYYQLLFDGKLGFTPAAVFTSYPSLFGISFNDDFADESFSVYEHPKTIVFQKTQKLSAATITQLLSASAPVENPQALLRRLLAFPALENDADLAHQLMATSVDVSQISWKFDTILSQISPILLWFGAVEMLALLAFPFTTLVFRKLPDTGYGISKIVGILLPSYAVWMLVSLNFLAYTPQTIVSIIVLLALASIGLTLKFQPYFAHVVRNTWKTFLVQEGVFVLAFACFLIYRAYNPDIFWSESSMDFSFLNVLLRAETLPPPDPWLAGEPLNYYYFGHFLVATLTKLTGILPQFTYNLAFALFPSIAIVGVFSLLYNLTRRYLWGGVGVLFSSILGNLDGFFLLMAIWRTRIRWFDALIKHAPFWDSVIGREPVYRFFRCAHEVIPYTVHEFPFWTFMFVDLHAHLLNMPFLIAVFLIGLHLLADEPFYPVHIRETISRSVLGEIISIGLCTLLVGTLAVISSWDYPTGLIFLFLMAGAKAYKNFQCLGTTKHTSLRPVWLVLGIILPGSILLYAPFYVSFSRSKMGLAMVGNLTTSFPDFFIIFGLFLFLIFSFLDFQMYRMLPHRSYWRMMTLTLGGIGLIYAIGRFVFQRNYATVLFLGFLIFLACYIMLKQQAMRTNLHQRLPDRIYVWLCVIYACLITAGCEIVFVKDFLQGGEYKRMNTIFKFYIPAWYLFAIAATYALFQLYQSWSGRRTSYIPPLSKGGSGGISPLRSLITWRWIAVAVALFLMSAVFPIMGSRVRRYHDLYSRTYLPPTLDGLAYLREKHPDEYRAIRWLNANVTGTPVILEASKDDYLYEYARISSNTGLPTVLGWQSHAEQREHWGQAHQRNLDIKEIYTSPAIGRVRQLLKQYDVTYIYVGRTERQDFPASGLWKFPMHPEYFEEVFRSGSTIVYRVKR